MYFANPSWLVALITLVFLMITTYVLRVPLRYTDAQLEEGDAVVHNEEVNASQLAARSGIMGTLAPEGGV